MYIYNEQNKNSKRTVKYFSNLISNSLCPLNLKPISFLFADIWAFMRRKRGLAIIYPTEIEMVWDRTGWF